MDREIDYTIKIADLNEREEIYKIRHDIYAVELKHYNINQQSKLMDDLDLFNTYIIAKKNHEVVGFLSLTPPGHKYSMDKYLQRDELPFIHDDKLYEIRICKLQFTLYVSKFYCRHIH